MDDDARTGGARTGGVEQAHAGAALPGGGAGPLDGGHVATTGAEPVVGHDRIRWGPIWAGALVALPVYLVLQLLFFALGWLELGFDEAASGTATALVSGLLALVALFVGGMVTGASTMWRRISDGVLHGVVVWALSIGGTLLVTLLGAGPLLGSAAEAVVRVSTLSRQLDGAQATEAARQAAGWGSLAIGLTLLAAVLGAVVGARLWPRRNRATTAR